MGKSGQLEHLRQFVVENKKPGGCKVLSEGSDCSCPLCDLNSIREVLDWYRDYVSVMSRDLKKKSSMDAAMASVTVLSLDAGQRAEAILR